MKKILSFFAALLAFNQSAMAHPHAFIEMQTRPLVQNQALTGFSMQWLLDEASSAEILYDLKMAKDDKELKKELAENIIKNIVAEHYFSFLYDQNGDKVKYNSAPKNYGLKAVGNQIMYYFDFFLSKPRALKNNQFILQTYDPTYYVAMSYEQKNAVDFQQLPSHCQGELVQAQVDEKTKRYAAALDKSQKDADFSLGAQFAQKVILICN